MQPGKTFRTSGSQRAFTLAEVVIAMAVAVLMGSGIIACLLTGEKFASRARLLTNGRAIVQRSVDTALGVSFTSGSTPPILAITPAAGVVYNDNGAAQQIVFVTRSGSTVG